MSQFNLKSLIRFFFLLSSVSIVLGCKDSDAPLFELIASSESHVQFNNMITESDSLNVLKFEYIYNGAGVGVGDFNNDGLTDLFFAGNMVSSRLYLNTGTFTFKDVTTQAGVETTAWCTGVAVSDINQDGLADIHISTAHQDPDRSSANLVFLNQGNNAQGVPLFIEVASTLGLADKSYSTQAAFFDYDLDGDLDMYLLTNALETYSRNILIGQNRGSGKSIDKLFRNDGNSESGLPIFKDISSEAGIRDEGWGLGIAIADINRDGYPDIYAANDFQSNDLLYINDRAGGFRNQIAMYLQHQSQNSMGIDIADFNNDGFEDIAVVDMMPDDNLRQKTMFPRIEYDRFHTALAKGYQPQYTRNVLQLNNGNGSFSDIGYMAGIFATDWSWSALFADFDNDGLRDLLISNGYKKDVTNLDFVNYRKQSTMFGTAESKEAITLKSIEELGGVEKPPFAFRNNGNLTFTDQASSWGLSEAVYSNGVAYADLDNDGDLDLVMNAINHEALIYRNNAIGSERHKSQNDSNNYIRLKLEGAAGNNQGIGAKVSLFYGKQTQFAEHKLQRGYKTSVDPIMHFGLGRVQRLDSLLIIWPRGYRQLLREVSVNQVLTLKENNAEALPTQKIIESTPSFEEVSDALSLMNKTSETDFADLKTQRLLIQKHSQGGPALAVGDVNGDSLEDLIIGGPAGKAVQFFLGQKNGTYSRRDSITKKEEDMGILLFDADNDHDLDLYCVSGSSEFGSNTELYQDRLYRNDGHGKFTLDTSALPEIRSSGSTVRACDFDKDNDLDLFVGGRIKPGEYPKAPESYLLRNNGKGIFEKITEHVAPALREPGMITDAIWSDFDNDGWTDLIVVGEFMPVTFFRNENGKQLSLYSTSKDDHTTDLDQTGLWNSINAGDFDNDGDTDYIAGNLGLNSFYRASANQPLTLYAKDYDQNGSIEPLLTHFNKGEEYLVHYRETLIDQLPMLRKKLTRFDIYGKSTFQDLFTTDMLKDALILKATELATSYFENLGNGKFSLHELPMEVQVAPVYGIIVTDFDSDGNLDIITVGNSHAAEPLSGWYDASIGNVLKGDGKGNFTTVPVTKTGFFVDGDAKSFVEVMQPDSPPLLVVGQNQDSLRVFQRRAVDEKVIRLTSSDQYADIQLKDGQIRKQEFYFGNGYLSQSSRALVIPAGATSVVIVDSKGRRREVIRANGRNVSAQ